MELPDQTDVNKTYQRRQFLCEIGDQREKETRFHNMKEGDSCKLKYSEVKSEEKCCEGRGLHFPAVCLERGAGARSLLCFPGYLPATALEPLAVWPCWGVHGLLQSSLALETAQGEPHTSSSHGAAAQSPAE